MVSRTSKSSEPQAAAEEKKQNNHDEKQSCGIVMPIAGIGDYDKSHWSDVLDILSDAVDMSGLTPNLVSAAEEASLIHTTIVQNLFDNPIVVCDVSGKNPNVMFELGLRLAFDKPTIIVKDDTTGYSFDVGNIEHLNYPRDLRFAQIVDFKAKLGEKIKATLKKAKSDPDYSTFLKHFKRVKVAKLEDTEISGQDFIIEQLNSLRISLERIASAPNRDSPPVRSKQDFADPVPRFHAGLSLSGLSPDQIRNFLQQVGTMDNVERTFIDADRSGEPLLHISFVNPKVREDRIRIERLRDAMRRESDPYPN